MAVPDYLLWGKTNNIKIPILACKIRVLLEFVLFYFPEKGRSKKFATCEGVIKKVLHGVHSGIKQAFSKGNPYLVLSK